MSVANRHVWIRAAILVGLVYLVIGRIFAVNHELLRKWRLAAWVLSAIAYGVHIWYEHVRLRSPPRSTAGHVALGIAIGAFGIAVAGMLHSLSAGTGLRASWRCSRSLPFLPLPRFLPSSSHLVRLPCSLTVRLTPPIRQSHSTMRRYPRISSCATESRQSGQMPWLNCVDVCCEM